MLRETRVTIHQRSAGAWALGTVCPSVRRINHGRGPVRFVVSPLFLAILAQAGHRPSRVGRDSGLRRGDGRPRSLARGRARERLLGRPDGDRPRQVQHGDDVDRNADISSRRRRRNRFGRVGHRRWMCARTSAPTSSTAVSATSSALITRHSRGVRASEARSVSIRPRALRAFP